MRILHTSDWHLDHVLHDHRREEEHAAFLCWLTETLLEQQAADEDLGEPKEKGSDDDDGEDGPSGSSWVMAEDLDGPGAEERAAAERAARAQLGDDDATASACEKATSKIFSIPGAVPSTLRPSGFAGSNSDLDV